MNRSDQHAPAGQLGNPLAWGGRVARSLAAEPWRLLLRRGLWLLAGLVVFFALANVAHAAGGAADEPDVFDLSASLSTATRLLLYGLVFLVVCLVSLAVPDAPLLVYLFSMSIAQFAGVRVGLTVLQCAIVLFRTGAPGLLVPSWALSFFLVCLTASAGWAMDLDGALWDESGGIVATLLQVPLMLATQAALRSKLTSVHRLLGAVVLGAIPGCIRTIQNTLVGVRYLEDQSAPDQNQYYMGFVPPDSFSTILIIGGIFLLFCFTSPETGRRGKWLAALVLPLVCVSLVLTGIRSSWIGFGLGTLLLLLRMRNAWALGGVILVFVLVAFLGLSGAVGLNLQEKVASRVSENSLGSGQARLSFWEVAVQGFAKRPILGIGWSCFPSFAADNTLGNKWATHSIFVRILCELGLVGVFLFLAWIAVTASRVRQSPLGGLVLVVMAGVLVQGLFLDHFIGSQFWFFLGLCEGVRRVQSGFGAEALAVGGGSSGSALPSASAFPVQGPQFWGGLGPGVGYGPRPGAHRSGPAA